MSRDEIEVAIAAAWGEYLHTTRSTRAERYDEVEQWAWARLRVRLKQLDEASAALAAAK